MENAYLYELLEHYRVGPNKNYQSNMQLPIINENKISGQTNSNVNLNIGNNNWFRIESRTNLSGFLEDVEINHRKNNGLFKKVNDDNRYF